MSDESSSLRLDVWKPGFTAELVALIRKYGLEAEHATPATLLAYYVLGCLNVLEATTTQRRHYQNIGWHPEAAAHE
jgi:hypothetical protein